MCSAAREEPLLPNYGKRRNSFTFPATYDGQTVQFVVNGEWTGLESTDIGRLPELGALGASNASREPMRSGPTAPTAPAAAFTEPCEDTPRGCRLAEFQCPALPHAVVVHEVRGSRFNGRGVRVPCALLHRSEPR
jgi:hypothetical protein